MPFTRAKRIAGYSRNLYVAAAVAVSAAVVVASLPNAPAAVRWVAWSSGLAIAWFACASFAAFHWMFDRSELLDGRWLTEHAAHPNTWVEINLGLEETTIPLETVFPESTGKLIDVYESQTMTEPAIARARHEGVRASTAEANALPIEDGWADLVVVVLVAHEIRDRRKREAFFRELARIASPRGRIVVIEHLRDLIAALTFGPGVFHFLPRREWLRLGRLTGLSLERERRITWFVRVFVFRNAGVP